ncbi:transmembrane efflux protein [Actinokineospora spheciospongiae]|uniref:Transmembrane efflux protein n=1 Tax=Actinokineospora spheciospongiae TaxID=909613 RepID=W7IUM5_9PSEU|nr:MFS transporter [Actinokineospora spheciospongiae]EWC60467.1 transmembrane efflux protein [Actinokineospora spheciospongiae]PWW66506.1 MFS transporter [Actinokineospora spheciospongiae]
MSARPLSALGLAAVLLGVLLPMMDSFIVNVALPTIAADLSASSADLELVVAGYGTAFTLFLVLGGRLGDAFGRRRVLVAGLAVFVVASLACAFATTAPWLVAARVAQGAAAALVPPQVLGTIQAAVPPERRAAAMSRYAAVSGLAAILGLVLGGLLVELDLFGTSWRLIFLVNLPLGVLAAVLCLLAVPDTRSPNPTGVDLRGTALLGAVVLLLLVPLNRGPLLGWPWWTVALLLLVPVAAIALWRVEKRVVAAGRVPLLPPAVLAEPRVRGGLVLVAPFLAAWAGFLFALPLTLQHGFGLDPLTAGLTVAPMSLAFLLGSFAIPALRTRLGERVLPAGALVQAAGVVWLLVLLGVLHAPVWAALPGLVLVGLGQALVVGASQISVLGAVPTAYAGVGGGVLVTTQQGSMAIGVAALGTLYATVTVGQGNATAFAVVLGVQLAIGLGVALAGRGMARLAPVG